ncbi:hypothetical protein [Bartonella taylorii]|nr:hypothetical protein [Bartonella taylorii]
MAQFEKVKYDSQSSSQALKEPGNISIYKIALSSAIPHHDDFW